MLKIWNMVNLKVTERAADIVRIYTDRDSLNEAKASMLDVLAMSESNERENELRAIFFDMTELLNELSKTKFE